MGKCVLVTDPRLSTELSELPDAPSTVPKSVEVASENAVAPLSVVHPRLFLNPLSFPEPMPMHLVTLQLRRQLMTLFFLPPWMIWIYLSLLSWIILISVCLILLTEVRTLATPVEKEKEVPTEVTSAKGVASASSPRFTRFLSDFTKTFSKLESSQATVPGEYL